MERKWNFANLYGLKLIGNINFGEEGNLSCSYCACDNWEAENFSMSFLTLEHSIFQCPTLPWLIQNFNYELSMIAMSQVFCQLKLYSIKIFGGSFNPVIQDCTLSEPILKLT